MDISQHKNAPYISRITITELFGTFDYKIPEELRSSYDRLLILYGDNGAGKTSVLKLIFALLSTKVGDGQKSFIARLPFRTFSVEFNNGTKVRVEKLKELIGPYTIQIQTESLQEYDVPLD